MKSCLYCSINFCATTSLTADSGIDQLQKILSVTGTPAPSLVQKMQSKDARSYVESLPIQKKKNFKDVFPSMDRKAVALLEAMLLLDPEKRVTAKEGLSHPYLSEFHDPESEPESPPYDDSFESMELVVGEWKSECTARTGQYVRTMSFSFWSVHSTVGIKEIRKMQAIALESTFFTICHGSWFIAKSVFSPSVRPAGNKCSERSFKIPSFLSIPGLIHMEIMTFDPDNPRETAT
ncbi:hypothetical protein Z043_111931 [Scleropages formosus]|uniref:Protein kinase domain-containing protein n=1 Tax=Scleropages formosus TaxID=113540 RepID=A0A0P7U5B2_SCLFO|nr:hypothetical protein Z043_111931 [Scleropages formosus]